MKQFSALTATITKLRSVIWGPLSFALSALQKAQEFGVAFDSYISFEYFIYFICIALRSSVSRCLIAITHEVVLHLFGLREDLR